VLWLSDFLATKWAGTVVIVSHARSFLNSVCTDIVHLQARTFTVYRGDYDTFEAVRAERARTQNRAAEAQSAKRAHVQSFIDKFRFNAKRAALVQSRIKALQRMADVRGLFEDPDTVFRFPEPAEASGQLISFNDVSFSYSPGGKRIFSRLSFGLENGSRVAIVGPNGIGKSTLLGLVGGTLAPTEGHVQRSSKARIAVFAQHHVDGLDMSLSPLGILVRAYPGVLELELRGHLGSFGISGPLALQPLYTLSGGQKSRVQFAKLTWPKPNLLLMDEVRVRAMRACPVTTLLCFVTIFLTPPTPQPTNHLDMDAIDALAEGLATWNGGVLLVSHDQHYITAVADQLWVCEGGSIQPYDGTFEDYKQLLQKQSK
jgi:ATP-binding cassette subfamily F protein 3